MPRPAERRARTVLGGLMDPEGSGSRLQRLEAMSSSIEYGWNFTAIFLIPSLYLVNASVGLGSSYPAGWNMLKVES